MIVVVAVYSLSHVPLFATLWTAAHQTSLSFTNTRSLLKLMSIESVIPSNHLILCCPLLLSFSASGSFPMSPLLASGDQSIGALASVIPLIIQGWFPLGLTGLISLLSKGLSRVFCGTTPQKHQFLGSHSSLWSNSHICAWLLEKNIALTVQTFVNKVMSLLFNMLSWFVVAFLPRSKHLLILWLQSPSTVILEPKKIVHFLRPLYK